MHVNPYFVVKKKFNLKIKKKRNKSISTKKTHINKQKRKRGSQARAERKQNNEVAKSYRKRLPAAAQ